MKYSVKALMVYFFAMAVVVMVIQFTPIQIEPLHISFLGLFMYGSSTLVHYMTIRSSTKDPKRFPAYFMAITGIKMLVYLATIGVYAYLFQELAIPMIIAFISLYVIYTALEVSTILSDLKKEQ